MPACRKSPPKTQPEVQSLDCRYGKIGISAVAAAIRYQSEPKNMAYAPVAPAATTVGVPRAWQPDWRAPLPLA
jgi:hypothetical protein